MFSVRPRISARNSPPDRILFNILTLTRGVLHYTLYRQVARHNKQVIKDMGITRIFFLQTARGERAVSSWRLI